MVAVWVGAVGADDPPVDERSGATAGDSGRSASEGDREQPEQSATRYAAEFGVLLSAESSSEERGAAARRLIDVTDGGAREAVAALLRDPGTPQESVAAFAREVSHRVVAPGWLVGPLADVAAAVSADRRPRKLSALGSIRSRDSVRALLRYTRAEHPAAVREAALAALTRLTGRFELGNDVERWHSWFSEVEWLTEAEWQRVLAEGLAGRADRVARDRERTVGRLVDVLRRTYLESGSIEARWEMAAAWLRDDQPAVRRLAIELIRREIANARVPTDEVAAAALELLSSPTAEFRLAGAELVYTLAPRNTAEAVNDALIRETDAEVAAALLRAVQRWPTVGAKGAVLEWLRSETVARPQAVRAAAALIDEGVFADREQVASVLDAVRRIPAAELPVSGFDLIARRGTAQDRSMMCGLLTGQFSGRTGKGEIARVLVPFEESLAALIEAAPSDPDVFRAAADALALHRPTLAGYSQLLSMRAPSEGARVDAVRALVGRMTTGQALAAARLTRDPVLREAALVAMLEGAAGHLVLPMHSAGAPVTPRPAVVAGMILLAQTRLAKDDPEGALAALEGFGSGGIAARLDGNPAVQALRLRAMVRLGRLEEAEAVGAPLSVWLDALEQCAGEPFAAEMLGVIESLFDSSERSGSARLESIRAAIVAGNPGERSSGPQ